MDKENQVNQKAVVEARKDSKINPNKIHSDPWGNQEIHIVDNAKKCQDVVKQLRLHCEEYNVLGIGCDRVKYNSKKIALLQLASHRGLCAIIRLYSLKKIPIELREILEDQNIVKVAVDVSYVAIKLIDYDVRTESILDLQYLASTLHHRYYRLDDLSKEYLKIKLGENHRLEQNHWKRIKTTALDSRNINYAAKSVRVTIELFKKFEEKLRDPSNTTSSTNGVQTFINDHCKAYLNQIYRYEKKKADENQTTVVEADQQKVQQRNELLRNQEVYVINNAEECRAVVEQLREHCNEYKVLGFGCKCSTSSRTVTLLQLASHRELVAIIKLRKLITIPAELQEILEDKNIIKVGERVSYNVDRLEGDYGVQVKSAIDIQYLAKECAYPMANLNRLSEKYLNIDIETHDWRLLHTDWRSDTISTEEINYAASTVRATIELFKLFKEKLATEKYAGDHTKFIDELCSSLPNKNHEKRKNEAANKKQEEDCTCTLPEQEIHVVSNAEECQAIAEQLRLHCNEYNVLGFDCEAKSPGGRKVALLQLATHRGLCVLVRLCKLKKLPDELQAILEDEKILKVGIMPHTDAKSLFEDYRIKVSGTFDLKNLAKKCKCKATGIGKLSEEVLKVKLSHKVKGLMTQKLHKKWENDILDDENIRYAADDAHVAVEIFKKFQEKLMPENQSDDQTENVQQFIDKHCTSYLVRQKSKK